MSLMNGSHVPYVDMASTTTYEHFSLENEDLIRVLRLLPSGNPEDPIRVELLPCRLTKIKVESPIEEPSNYEDEGDYGQYADGPARERRNTQSRFKCNAEIQYEALSYAWGDLEDKDKPLIYISEHATSYLPVTRNCFNALKALRQGEKSRHLWIDAVCIDQADLEERSHQVRNMARIYASASCTIIYLGEHNESSRVLFQWMSEELGRRGELGHNDDFRILDFIKPPSAEVFHGVRELVQRPWFRRVWVLQEVYLSRKALVFCGGDVSPCAILIGFWNQIFDPRVDFIGQYPMALSPDRGVHWHSSQVWSSLLRYLGATRRFLASDSRDRIFALKALLGPQQDEIDRHIDYKKTFEEISVELATKMINNFGIDLLKMSRQGHNLDMPSWVPDWSQNSELSLYKWVPNYKRILL